MYSVLPSREWFQRKEVQQRGGGELRDKGGLYTRRRAAVKLTSEASFSGD